MTSILFGMLAIWSSLFKWNYLKNKKLFLKGKTTSRISTLMKSEILGVFVKTLTADENYPFGDSGDLHFPI